MKNYIIYLIQVACVFVTLALLAEPFKAQDGLHGALGIEEDGENGHDGEQGYDGKSGGQGGNGGSSLFGNGGHGGHGGNAD